MAIAVERNRTTLILTHSSRKRRGDVAYAAYCRRRYTLTRGLAGTIAAAASLFSDSTDAALL